MTMAGDLILLPVRLYFRAARFAVRTGLRATEEALTLATQVIRSVTPDGSAEAPEPSAPTDAAATAPDDAGVESAASTPSAEPQIERLPDSERVPEPARASEPARAGQPAPSADVPAPEVAPLRAEPIHVSEEPTVVEEFAEPGAEEGAGAQVTVDEPWEGYARMSARDIVARLADAAPEELAAVQLYESAHKQRETVITAAARELRAKSGRGAITADQSRKEHPDG
jgi:hypothetical protein